MSYLDDIEAKRQGKKDDDDKQAFTDSLDGVSTDIRTLLASLETSGAKKLDAQVVNAIASLGSIVQAIQALRIENDEESKEVLREIAETLSSLNVSPIVNVPKAQITVQERNIDFDPLIKALDKKEEVETDDDPLAGYKAQDINSDDPHVQYVGFINPQGSWYIIENNDTTNTLRYKFGKKGYSTAFKNMTKHNYKLYSEAIREVTA